MRIVALVVALLAVGLAPVLAAPGQNATPGVPPIRHVWEIVLENENFGDTFGSPSVDPYLASVLPSEGELLPDYYATGHASLDNYISLISGQAPDVETQDDCDVSGYLPFVAVTTDLNGQAVGQGCEYPARTLTGEPIQTLPGQLTQAGYSWKGYMQGMGDDLAHDGAAACAHPTTGQLAGGLPNPEGEDGSSNFAVKHDPFAYFDSLIDDPSCPSHVVPLEPSLQNDLASASTTPNFSFITPDLVWDGHDTDPQVTDLFLRKIIPMITSSPAYEQDGMVVITYDESGGDTSACCHELPGPGSPAPGEAPAGGGGRIGALVLSPFVRPGAVDPTPYNHYSLLRTVEDVFGLGHIGFAGTYLDYPGPGSFGCDAWTAWASCRTGVPPTIARTSGGPVGPRAADGTSTWVGPSGAAGNLTAVACAAVSVCLAVGDTGTALVSKDQGTDWSPIPTGTVDDLRGVACPSPTRCVAVGTAGAVVDLDDSTGEWAVAVNHVGTPPLNAVSCVAAHCVAVGDDVIVRSDDGGMHWAPAHVVLPEPGPGSTDQLLGVACPTVSNCVAVGSLRNTDPNRLASPGAAHDNVLVSADGARTWHLEAAGALRLRAVSCASSHTCTAVGESGAIEQTTDGVTWSGVAAPQTPVGTSALNGSRDLLDGVACTGSCVAVGATPTIGSELSSFARVGAVQATAVRVARGSASLQATHTTSALRGVACAATFCVAVGDHGVIDRRVGAGWVPVAGGSSETLTSIACATPSWCATGGSSASSFGATEGAFSAIRAGSQWTSRLVAAPPGARVNGISCPGPGVCVGVGDAGVVVHGGVVGRAGGGTGGDDLRAVSCASSTSCVAVGDHGVLLVSSDGGAHWTAVASHVGSDLTAVSCVAPRQCVAVGASGVVLALRGAAVSRVPTLTPAILTGVACTAPSSCLAVGSSGTIVTIAGTSSTVASSGYGDQLNAIACASGTTCVAAGSAGTVLETTDGGAAWTARGTGNDLDLRGVACPSATACLEVGDAGGVLSTPL